MLSEAEREEITAVFQLEGLYCPYGGPKMCRGYHPDFCFEWSTPKGPLYAMTCFGCHEIIWVGPTELICDVPYMERIEKVMKKVKAIP